MLVFQPIQATLAQHILKGNNTNNSEYHLEIKENCKI